jgi:hypothetical protein
MNLEKLIVRVTEELETTLPDSLEASEREAVVDLVRRAMQDSSTRTTRELKATASMAVGPDSDLAHKLQDQMDKKTGLLIANLSAMR